MILAFLLVVLFIVAIRFLGYHPTAFTDYPSLPNFILVFITSGPGLMGFSLGVLVFFMDYVNKSYWYTQFFSVTMYTAYIDRKSVV